MLQDVATPIDAAQQLILAHWALKSAMVTESVADRVHAFYLKEERESLREFSQIPNNTFVWLARFIGKHDLAHVAMHLWSDEPGKLGTIHCYVNTIGFGCLALQVFSAHVPDGQPRVNVPAFIAPWRHFLLQVWPPVDQARFWPPEMTFNETGVLSFGDLVNRFRPKDAKTP